jgi:outer membrane scaffolding protein for murein synthesis (MipA/OmpV family)
MKRTQILVSSLMIVLAAQILHAQQPGWEFSVGAGIGGETVYSGSDDYYIAPLPSVKASYSSGNVNYSLSILEGLGITYMNPNWGLMASASVNAGATRDREEYTVIGVPVKHSARTRALLAGSPNLNTPLAVTTMLAYPSPIGLFGVSLGIHPTSVEYNRTDRQDETRNGMLYSLLYTVGGRATEQLSFSGLFSIEFMDQTYADTWYSVDKPTNSLSAHKADAGLRNGLIALEMSYRISERISLSAVGASTILMSDAKDSPYTVETVQRAVTAQMLYHF